MADAKVMEMEQVVVEKRAGDDGGRDGPGGDGDLEAQVKFSWRRIAKRGVQNMKDDIDPVYKGAKMGLFALHGIPTWVRQHRDGKLSVDSRGWAIASGLFVGAGSVVAYGFATVALGPGILAAPVVAQGLSYTREAFRRARKTEWENVVMTKVQRRLNNQDRSPMTYDVSCEVMVESLATELYNSVKKDINHDVRDRTKYKNKLVKDKEFIESARDINSVNKREKLESIESEIKDCEQYITRLQNKIEAYKEKAPQEAKVGLAYLARDVFNGLFADNDVGNKYDMDAVGLEVGPHKRQKDYEREMFYKESPKLDESKKLAKLLNQKIMENNGVANVELFGKMTIVYDGKEDAATHYHVEPNEIWSKD